MEKTNMHTQAHKPKPQQQPKPNVEKIFAISIILEIYTRRCSFLSCRCDLFSFCYRSLDELKGVRKKINALRFSLLARLKMGTFSVN